MTTEVQSYLRGEACGDPARELEAREDTGLQPPCCSAANYLVQSAEAERMAFQMHKDALAAGFKEVVPGEYVLEVHNG